MPEIPKFTVEALLNELLEERDDLIVLIVEDAGKGFNLKNKKNLSKGLGLIGIKERVLLMGGTLEIGSAARRGTTVFVRIQASVVQKQMAES